MKTTFTECHIDYFDSEENRWCIDTWSTPDMNEDGEVVGWIDGTSGNIYYRNPYAEECPMIQEMAAAKQREVREEQKRKRGCMGENIAMLTSQVWNRVYPYMREPDCTQLAAEIRDAAYEFEKEWNDTPEEKRDGYYIDMIDVFANRLTAKLRDLLCDVPTPCSNIRVIKAVANEIENMMYNDINEGNGIEGFEGWCNGGEVFEESGLDVEECMQLVREVAPIVDNLVYKHLNVDQAEML